MKNLFFGILLLTAFIGNAQAVKYGVKAGINISTLEGDFFDDSDSRIGFAAGFFAIIPFDNTFSFQPEILYSAQGINTTVEGEFTDQREELDYLQLPLLLRADFGSFNFHLGPQVGVGVWNSFNTEVYKNFDYSALAGIGLDVTKAFFIEARYSYGFRNIIEDAVGIEGKKRYFQFMVGYKL